MGGRASLIAGPTLSPGYGESMHAWKSGPGSLLSGTASWTPFIESDRVDILATVLFLVTNPPPPVNSTIFPGFYRRSIAARDLGFVCHNDICLIYEISHH